MAVPTTLNPWRERGIPLDKQLRSWKEIAKSPYDKLDVDAYTRTRVILMNGIEIEAWSFSHQFHRSTDNQEIRALLAQIRRVDQQQQTTINGLNPGDQTIIETTIGYEQVAIDMTAYLARNEPDPYVRESMNFGLLEDFDHLYRYSELLDYLEGTDPNTIVQGKTDILPGRPTQDHHNNPEVRLLRHYEKNRALPLSKLHIMTLLSGEQQTYNYYKNVGAFFTDPLARRLYAEIGEVEEEHVTFYGSLLDPTETMLERQVLHELMEVYNYLHCVQQETDERIKGIWDQFLHMELTHLQLWADMMRKYEGRDPAELFGETLTVEFKFQENKEYIRRTLERQRDVRELPIPVDGGPNWVMKDDLPKAWPSYRYQAIANADGVPSEEIVDRQRREAKRTERPGNELLERARELAVQFRGATDEKR
jgi:rubrerythrin